MTPRKKQDYLRGLVAAKNRWSRPLTDEEKTLGFLGWHERGYLPHCDFPDLIQFVTLRLADSMPLSRCGEWEHLLGIEDVRERRTKLEDYLDRGFGACRFQNTHVARFAQDALLHFHASRYELLAWCVMPNHLHVLVHVWRTPLWKLVPSWKRFVAAHAPEQSTERRTPFRAEDRNEPDAPNRSSALQANAFWQREYWDTFMRDEDQKRKAIRYIENNPAQARLCQEPDQWLFSSARFRDNDRRLKPPRTGAPNSDSAR